MVAELELGCFAPDIAYSSQDRTYTGDQFAGFEWLSEIVVGATLKLIASA